MPVETIISLVVSIGALLFTAFSFRRTANKDLTTTATERANMTADIRYIRDAIDDIKLENRGIKKDLDDLKVKVAKVEESVDSAHARLDELKKG